MATAEKLHFPEDIHLTDEQKKKAAEVLYDGNIMTSYIRTPPTVSEHKDNRGRTSQYIAKGQPMAAMVAFLMDGKLYVGWSKYNEKAEKKGPTKTTGRLYAICRAITSEISVDFDKRSAKMSDGSIIPHKICKEIGQFTVQAAARLAPVDAPSNVTGIPKSTLQKANAQLLAHRAKSAAVQKAAGSASAM